MTESASQIASRLRAGTPPERPIVTRVFKQHDASIAAPQIAVGEQRISRRGICDG